MKKIIIYLMIAVFLISFCRASLYSNDTDLITWLKMDESSGNLMDSKDNGLPQANFIEDTAFNNMQMLPLAPNSNYSMNTTEGALYHGDADFISLFNSMAHSHETSLPHVTYSMWLTTPQSGAFAMFDGLESQDFTDISYLNVDGINIISHNPDGLMYEIGCAEIYDGNIHHIVISLSDTGVVRFYNDGVTCDTGGDYVFYMANISTFSLFQSDLPEIIFPSASPIIGSVDEVSIWGRELSGDEISLLYSEGIKIPEITESGNETVYKNETGYNIDLTGDKWFNNKAFDYSTISGMIAYIFLLIIFVIMIALSIITKIPIFYVFTGLMGFFIGWLIAVTLSIIIGILFIFISLIFMLVGFL